MMSFRVAVGIKHTTFQVVQYDNAPGIPSRDKGKDRQGQVVRRDKVAQGGTLGIQTSFVA
jgi:hypothetical protein